MPERPLAACAALLALASAGGICHAADLPAPRPPNVVVIYVDDQSRDSLGCYGGIAPTPRIDGLARDGVRCDRYYANSAVCCASRYALLSGRYASRSQRYLAWCRPGMPARLGWDASIMGEAGTLPQVMRAAGYATGMVGKWHQDWDGPQPGTMPAEAGFEGPATQALMRANYALACDAVRGSGFAWVDGLYWSNIDDGGKRAWMPRFHQFHNPEWTTAAALRFIDENKERPFLLYAAPTLAHSPRPMLSLLNANVRSSAAGALPADPEAGMPSRPEMLARIAQAGFPRRMSEKDQRMHRWEAGPEGAATAMWIDASVGAILDRLDRHGLARDTLVVYSSDNGHHPGKFTAYEEGSHLPLVIRWPAGLPAGAASQVLASTVDLAPTIYAACGIQAPAEARLDGVDLLPALRGQAPGQATVYLENACSRAVVDSEGWKYLAVRIPPELQARAPAGAKLTQWGRVVDGKDQHTFGADKAYPHYFANDQLYQVNRDPEERNNLATDPACATRLATLKARLTTYSASLPHSFGEFRPATDP